MAKKKPSKTKKNITSQAERMGLPLSNTPNERLTKRNIKVLRKSRGRHN